MLMGKSMFGSVNGSVLMREAGVHMYQKWYTCCWRYLATYATIAVVKISVAYSAEEGKETTS